LNHKEIVLVPKLFLYWNGSYYAYINFIIKENFMSEIIGTFELDHICNTFTTDENNMITNHTNWRGTAEGFGAVFGTLTFSPTHLSEMDEKLKGGEVRWTGNGFLEDGTSNAATGTGTWEKDEGGHIWRTDTILEFNDGSKARSIGRIELATLKFSGTIYAID